MSWSFHVRNGDLNPSGPGGLAQVTGTQKLVQDLRCALLEPLGTDYLHPDYGSSLDGGVDTSGNVVPSFIGMAVNPSVLLDIESEIRRILAAYQTQQLDRLYRDQAALGGKNTFAQGEILASVDSVNVDAVGDVLNVTVQITTADGDTVTIAQPVGLSS